MAGSKLLQEMRAVLRRKHYSTRTEQAYCEWVRRFVKFHQMKNRDQFEGGESVVRVTAISFSVPGSRSAIRSSVLRVSAPSSGPATGSCGVRERTAGSTRDSEL